MPNISDVFKVNIQGLLDYRNTKYCVCVSALLGKYLYINTKHREIYDDFEINSSDYGFLGSVNRVVSCLKLHQINSNKLIERVGNLTRGDMLKIKDKIQESKTINKLEKDSVLPELLKWLLGDI